MASQQPKRKRSAASDGQSANKTVNQTEQTNSLNMQQYGEDTGSVPREQIADTRTRANTKRMEAEDYLNEEMRRGNSASSVNPVRQPERTLPIGREQINNATATLNKYKMGKASLERKIVENELWYKMRHWDVIDNDDDRMKVRTAWTFNMIANKHADAMDNFPSPNILPREEGDKGEAEILTAILPVILDMNQFEGTYSKVWDYKLKTGTGVYGVFWDSSKLNGLGDVAIKKIDLINLFWESGITDIQDSRNLFHVTLIDNDIIESKYPAAKGRLGTASIDIAKYVYDDAVDTSEKSAVIDWYYKKVSEDGRTVLHYCKYVNDIVLYATENEPELADRGLYDHGKYPFVFDPLFCVEGSPAGFGYIDVAKSPQEYIDRGGQAIMQNMFANSKPRYFINNSGAVHEEEFADQTKDFVHVDGNLGSDSIIPIEGKPLNAVYVNIIQDKIEELKETTGNRDIQTGGSTSGVTAASAIAAMQEAGSKLSRDANKAAYRAFEEVCMLVIEIIRQFYDLPRYFRITGQNGVEKFVEYTNQGLQPIPVNAVGPTGVPVDYTRIPVFDIKISAQKQSPYSKMAQNELAIQFFNAGFFNPSIADQALACLEMMDFDRKEPIMRKIAQNGGMLQQMLALAQMVDAVRGSGEAVAGIANQYGISVPNGMSAENQQILGDENIGESEHTKKARERVAQSTSPV